MEVTLAHAAAALLTFLLLLLHRRHRNKLVKTVPTRTGHCRHLTLLLDQGVRGDEGVFGGGQQWTKCGLSVEVPRYKRDPISFSDLGRQQRGLGVCGAVVIVGTVSWAWWKPEDARAALSTANSSHLGWLLRLLLNCVGYSSLLLPLYLLNRYLQKINYFEKPAQSGCTWKALWLCFGESGGRLPEYETEPHQEGSKGAVRLAACFVGLMGSYLIWGLLQEKIMTQSYSSPDGDFQFRDAQFLVFVNRSAAFVLSLCRLWWSGQGWPAAPLHKFSYCALTNVVSAWCQYEALNYVSFPTQVLSKSCKVIPVMLMGRLVSGARYSLHEYGTAALISLGMLLFLFGARGPASHAESLEPDSMWAGVPLLALYLTCDSFTSSWQGALFRRYSLSAPHMMCAVSLFSSLLTALSLLHQPDTARSVSQMQHPALLLDVSLLSVSSTVGQLFIYFTIEHFGPVVFTIIMTLRQATSILLSCVVYGHAVSASGAAGVVLVFGAAVARVLCRAGRAPRKP